MKVKELKGWKKLNDDFLKWEKNSNYPEWEDQQEWLSKELVKRKFVERKDLLQIWSTFNNLTQNCGDWKIQNKILSFSIVCNSNQYLLENYIK